MKETRQRQTRIGWGVTSLFGGVIVLVVALVEGHTPWRWIPIVAASIYIIQGVILLTNVKRPNVRLKRDRTTPTAVDEDIDSDRWRTGQVVRESLERRVRALAAARCM